MKADRALWPGHVATFAVDGHEIRIVLDAGGEEKSVRVEVGGVAEATIPNKSMFVADHGSHALTVGQRQLELRWIWGDVRRAFVLMEGTACLCSEGSPKLIDKARAPLFPQLAARAKKRDRQLQSAISAGLGVLLALGACYWAGTWAWHKVVEYLSTHPEESAAALGLLTLLSPAIPAGVLGAALIALESAFGKVKGTTEHRPTWYRRSAVFGDSREIVRHAAYSAKFVVPMALVAQLVFVTLFLSTVNAERQATDGDFGFGLGLGLMFGVQLTCTLLMVVFWSVILWQTVVSAAVGSFRLGRAALKRRRQPTPGG